MSLGARAIETIQTSTFFMNDNNSYLLLFVGLLAAVFATHKSFGLDDPYPGYGKLSREQDELAEDFNYEQTLSFEEMNVLVDDYSTTSFSEANSL